MEFCSEIMFGCFLDFGSYFLEVQGDLQSQVLFVSSYVF